MLEKYSSKFVMTIIVIILLNKYNRLILIYLTYTIPNLLKNILLYVFLPKYQ